MFRTSPARVKKVCSKEIGGHFLSGLLGNEDHLSTAVDMAQGWIAHHAAKQKNGVRDWMLSILEIRLHKYMTINNDIITAKLAQDAADYFKHSEWLDDHDHWLWNIAIEVVADFEM